MNTTTSDVLTGHPAKLRSGEWGAHVDGHEAKHGDIVRLRTKAGKEWDAVIDRVVWAGNDSDGKACALATLMPENDRGSTKPRAGGKTAPASAADDAGALDDEPF